MTTLVVGGTGLLGRAVCERIDGAVGVSRRAGFDFFTEAAVEHLREIAPKRVVVAATVEQSAVPRPAYDAAVERFVDACQGRRLVYVSSDAVFGGEDGGYSPSAEPTPVDEYGRRLTAFESAVDPLDDAVVLRPSYLYSDDPLDPRLAAVVDALADGGTYERFEDVYRSPAHVADVAEAVATLATGRATGTLHVPGPRLSVYEFHQQALNALGFDADGLVPTHVPPDAKVARDRSLVAPRFASVTGVEIGPPAGELPR